MKNEQTTPGYLSAGAPILKQTEASKKALSRQARIRYAVQKLKPVEVSWNSTQHNQGEVKK